MAGGYNVYAYVGGSPTVSVDPLGLVDGWSFAASYGGVVAARFNGGGGSEFSAGVRASASGITIEATWTRYTEVTGAIVGWGPQVSASYGPTPQAGAGDNIRNPDSTGSIQGGWGKTGGGGSISVGPSGTSASGSVRGGAVYGGMAGYGETRSVSYTWTWRAIQDAIARGVGTWWWGCR